ncbi:MAG TPA: hypothetical protein VMT03_13200 [Polyangia bacterium]|nr:hypothetical protein [Polyangia bacterium]
MSSNKKHVKSSHPVTSRARAAKKSVVKHASSTVKGVPGRAKRFVKSNPVRILLGASALGLVLAKLKHILT